MKKFFSIFVFAFAIVLLSCENGHTADVGVRITTKVPAHGHQTPIDGGILKISLTELYVTDISNSFVLSAGTSTTVNFLYEKYDTLNLHSTTVEPTKTIIPVGYNYARVSLLFTMFSGGADFPNGSLVQIYNSGVEVQRLYYIGTVIHQTFAIPALTVPVVAGDYLQVKFTNNSAESHTYYLKETYGRFVVELLR